MGDFNFSRNQQLALLALIGLALVGLAFGHIRSARSDALSSSGISIGKNSPGRDVEIDSPKGIERASKNDMPTVTVHVTGCVHKSGVYTLPTGSRVVDAVKSAGGEKQDANLEAINLAERLKDGEQVDIPSKESAVSQIAAARGYSSLTSHSGRSSASHGRAGTKTSGVVNINSAGPEELDRLPGVGPATAAKIIDYRNSTGRFNSVDQLLEVKGIGPKKLEKMRPFVRL